MEESKKDNTDKANKPKDEQLKLLKEPLNLEEIKVLQVKGFKLIPPLKYNRKEDLNVFLI